MNVSARFLKTSLAAALATVVAAPMAMAQTPEKVRIGVCGGGASGTYIKVAKYIKYMLEGQGGTSPFEVTAYTTDGSKDNLELMTRGVCQVSVIQSDANEWQARQAHMSHLQLRTVNQAYKEHFHLVCHRDLKVEDIGELAALGTSGRATVYAGSENSGGFLTFENLKALRPRDYDRINVVPNGANGQLDGTQNALNLAMTGKACAAFVSRAPYSHLVQRYASQTNTNGMMLVSMDDGRFDNVRDRNNNRIYNFIKFHDLPENPYQRLAMRSPESSWGRGERTVYGIELSANVVVNVDWEGDLLGQLNARGQSGTAQRWQRTLQNVARFNGNFTQIDPLLTQIQVRPAPRN